MSEEISTPGLPLAAPLEGTRRGIVATTLFALLGIALLIALGVWQIERKAWKENLIATINARVDHAPGVLPPPEDWAKLTAAANEYRRVSFPAQFIKDREALVYTAGSALRPDVKGPGYWVFAPARLAGGSLVVVNRGFVPLDHKAAASGTQDPPQTLHDIVGYMRWPEKPGWFTPAADAKENIWFMRDPTAMARANAWGSVAPFYIDQESPVPPGGLPLPGKIVVTLPDNHLQYAITWFALAAILVGTYAAWLFRRIRGTPQLGRVHN